jgi:hypothetical protein
MKLNGDMIKNEILLWYHLYDKRGIYLVKSAYRVCVDVMIDRSAWKVDGDWNKIWALPIPPKV